MRMQARRRGRHAHSTVARLCMRLHDDRSTGGTILILSHTRMPWVVTGLAKFKQGRLVSSQQGGQRISVPQVLTQLRSILVWLVSRQGNGSLLLQHSLPSDYLVHSPVSVPWPPPRQWLTGTTAAPQCLCPSLCTPRVLCPSSPSIPIVPCLTHLLPKAAR